MKLSERLETEGPSRELDAEIAESLLGWRVLRAPIEPGVQYVPMDSVKCFSTSLDAALALCREVLPDHRIVMMSPWYRDGVLVASFGVGIMLPVSSTNRPDWEGTSDHDFDMALCAAIARAKGL